MTSPTTAPNQKLSNPLGNFEVDTLRRSKLPYQEQNTANHPRSIQDELAKNFQYNEEIFRREVTKANVLQDQTDRYTKAQRAYQYETALRAEQSQKNRIAQIQQKKQSEKGLVNAVDKFDPTEQAKKALIPLYADLKKNKLIRYVIGATTVGMLYSFLFS